MLQDCGTSFHGLTLVQGIEVMVETELRRSHIHGLLVGGDHVLQSLILTGSLALESLAAGTAAKHASSRRDSALLAVGCAGRWQGYVCMQDKLVLPHVHTRRAHWVVSRS